MFFENNKIPLNDIIKKIDKLERAKNSVSISFSTTYDDSKWSEVKRLAKEINEDFKNCSSPSKMERQEAWQRFFRIRGDAYDEMNRLYKLRSNEYHSDLFKMITPLKFSLLTEAMFFFDQETVESMKKNGKWLKEAGQHFKSVKHEMTREHKTAVHEKLVEVRESHDVFWSRYKEQSDAQYRQRKAEKQKAWEDKQRAWEAKKEKSKQVKESIRRNLEKNKENLRKTEDFLERLEGQRRDLQDKIWESSNPNWKDKAEGWLSEKDDKISDVEGQIRRIREWIREGQDKLDSWTDW